jgi:hypothetical protein
MTTPRDEYRAMSTAPESRWLRTATLMYNEEHGDVARDDDAVIRWLVRRVGGWDKTASQVAAAELNAEFCLHRLQHKDHEHERVPVGSFKVMDTMPGEFHNRGGLTFRRMACGCVMLREWSLSEHVSVTERRWTFRIIALVPAREWESVVRAVAVLATAEGDGRGPREAV